jgi:hypothetical protein
MCVCGCLLLPGPPRQLGPHRGQLEGGGGISLVQGLKASKFKSSVADPYH